MGERTQHAPGTFSWAELSTPDQAAARAFYGALFGWEADDQPAGEGVVYSMMKRDGHYVGAIAPQQQAQRDAGAPPAWGSYVTVASADDAAARAAELGGTVHAPPFDVFDAGRMAVMQDPQGAFFMVWQPNRHIGARLVNAPGALVWNELASSDLDGARAFYAGLFGWELESSELGDAPYLMIRNAGRGNGGMRGMTPGEPVPYWLVYFGVEQLDASIERVRELGGAIHAGPLDIQVGKIAVAADPQGAIFVLYDGMLEP
jgi:predicted enzyme related to lactoylglutathione lyase